MELNDKWERDYSPFCNVFFSLLESLRNLLDDDFFSKLAEEAEKDGQVRPGAITSIWFVIWILIGQKVFFFFCDFLNFF